MNIYIFCQYRNYFSPSQMRKLKKAANHVILVKAVQPIGKNIEIMQDPEEKIVAIDPDSCSWTISNKEISRIPNLKAIVFNTTSYDFIDYAYCREKNIVVTNNRDFAAEAVAEWLLMMSLMIARKIPLVMQNNWEIDYQKHMGIELAGRIAGIIGLGHVGKRIAELCKALGMKVIYWSPHSRDSHFTQVPLSTLFKTADFIYPCLAKNPETLKLIHSKHLLSMKTS